MMNMKHPNVFDLLRLKYLSLANGVEQNHRIEAAT